MEREGKEREKGHIGGNERSDQKKEKGKKSEDCTYDFSVYPTFLIILFILASPSILKKRGQLV